MASQNVQEILKLHFSVLSQVCVFVCVCARAHMVSHIQLFMTPWTVAHQAPLSMEFSRQEYWSGLPFPSPEDLLNPGIEPRSPALQADSLPSESPGSLAPSKPRSLSVHENPGPCHSHPPRASYRTCRQLRLALPHPGHACLKN